MGIFSPFTYNNLPQRGLKRIGDRIFLVSVAEAKEHLRIGHSDDDNYILNLTKAAQLTAEYYSNTDFTAGTWLFTCDIWSQTQKITASDATYDDQFGFSVSIYETTIMIGANGATAYEGAVYVFEKSQNRSMGNDTYTWLQTNKLNASNQFHNGIILS